MNLKVGVTNSNVSPRRGLNGLVVFLSIHVRRVVEKAAMYASLFVDSVYFIASSSILQYCIDAAHFYRILVGSLK